MLIRTDPESSQPLFEQVAGSIRAEVAAGRLRAGDRLPAAREVAHGLDLNVHTVLHAYQALRDEGLVELRRGRGATITPAAEALADLSTEITALIAKARAVGLSPDSLAALVKELA